MAVQAKRASVELYPFNPNFRRARRRRAVEACMHTYMHTQIKDTNIARLTPDFLKHQVGAQSAGSIRTNIWWV